MAVQKTTFTKTIFIAPHPSPPRVGEGESSPTPSHKRYSIAPHPTLPQLGEGAVVAIRLYCVRMRKGNDRNIFPFQKFIKNARIVLISTKNGAQNDTNHGNDRYIKRSGNFP